MPLDRDGSKSAASSTPRPGVNGAGHRAMTPALTGGASDPLRANLALMAPGTALRDGLERILRGRTGALIVLGYDAVVETICTGSGFPLDVEFSATRLRELCKMDGAVVMSSDGTRIVRAAVHLMPDPSIPSEESGTRHRTAERVAKQSGFPVISVSQSMHIIGLYVNGQRHVLDDSAAILSRANQALATLERYKLRLDEVSGTLSALEIEDLVTVRDAVAVVQRLEMVRRIADEISGYVVELGTDGRLLALQLDELMAGVDADRTLVIRDYLPTGRKARTLDEALVELDLLTATEMIDLVAVAKAIGYPGASDSLDSAVSPRGFRLLAKVPRLPAQIVDRLVDHFGSLQRLLGATVEDLQAVEGVGDARARGVREGLSRLAEASILERYV
ncbi:DNA integrity scanning diadenylate cyclase DisA [Actinoplanes couchii]|uniref:DNA integrity scanning protein DisA n=1 Tax=Actinoplanes couchii TaxID=403638 RepID=A0ABQ3XAL3_9ACTN|nr:DNA integrity scanning diadenylate cyclase DisA [Actinoplanes couchii]MDR6324838.1 diadenylate cyclase [Actinoplanes couchii]GID55540.1 DNA integrity scanning protein DisA [Actinoplanes couchii]